MTIASVLESVAGLLVQVDEATRWAERDFGNVGQGRVLASVRPTSRESLVGLVGLARKRGFSLVPRALGLSQSGQSLAADGVSVDMREFGGVEIDVERGVARCGSAVSWRQLLAHSAPHGLAPMVSPLNLDVSLGGTLSAGGVGTNSFKHGLAVAAVEELEVVLGTGEPLCASPTLHPDVFHAVLGGVGAFGFITSVTLRLRRMAPRLHTLYLLYDELPALLEDARWLAHDPACAHIEGFASAALQGLRLDAAGKRTPLARWFYGLQVSAEHSGGARLEVQELEARWLDALHHREVVHREDTDPVEHAARYDLRFETMRSTGTWQLPHPWLECFLSPKAALEVLPELVPSLPLALGDGHRIILVANVERPDLLMCPEESPFVTLGVLPTGIAPGPLPSVLAALREAHERLVAAGGKRYLSGWLFEPDDDAWRRHYGDRYERWRRTKQALDPDHVLRSVLRPA